MPPEVAATLLKIVAKREPTTSSLLTEYIKECGSGETRRKQSPQVNSLEGTVYERLSRQPVRSKALRDAKIRETLLKNTGHLVCEVSGCKFDFLETYGELGRGFAHVHHRRSLAKRKASRTTLSELAIVCANCHAMLHRWGECRSLYSIKATKMPKR
jgi:predicted HNH restriction endonuclease